MPTQTQPGITKKEAIESLRAVERLLHSDDVVDAVAELPFAEQLRFDRARIAFGNYVTRLNAKLMQEIGDDLQAQARSLRQGIGELSDKLDKLEGAVQWAKTINGITECVAKVVKIF